MMGLIRRLIGCWRVLSCEGGWMIISMHVCFFGECFMVLK
jgi:hypothetical protein